MDFFGCIFLLPFLAVEFNLRFGWDIGILITFGLDVSDFFTLWVTIFGVIGLLINISINSNRLRNQDLQLVLQSKSIQEERFSRGVELLSSENDTSRIAGAYSLFVLAKDYKDDYAEKIFKILCSHLQKTTSVDDYKSVYEVKPSVEVQEIIKMLFNSGHKDYPFKHFKNHFVDCHFSGVYIENADFSLFTFSRVNFSLSDFTNSNFYKRSLACLDFDYSCFKQCNFSLLNMVSCSFNNSTFNFCEFRQARMLNCFFIEATLDCCKFERTSIMASHLDLSNIKACLFDNAYLFGDSSVIFSSIAETDILNSYVEFVLFCGSDIINSSLEDSYFSSVNFRNCLIQKTSAYKSDKIPSEVNVKDSLFFNNRELFLKRKGIKEKE